MKKVLWLLLMLPAVPAWACEVCEKRQPKPLRGIAHGAGPESDWDYLIVAAITAIVVLCLYYAVKWLIRPGEKNTDHIKYRVLYNDNA